MVEDSLSVFWGCTALSPGIPYDTEFGSGLDEALLILEGEDIVISPEVDPRVDFKV